MSSFINTELESDSEPDTDDELKSDFDNDSDNDSEWKWFLEIKVMATSDYYISYFLFSYCYFWFS